MGDSEAWIADLWTREAHPCVRVRTYPNNLVGIATGLRDGFVWALSRLRWRVR
jgi:hypothetical protein